MYVNKKVLAAGHICLDITPVFNQQKVTKLTDLLSPGKLIHVGRPDIHLGGSVANTGLAMSILGANVRLAAKIGCDEFGQLVKQNLKRYTCEAELVEDNSIGTSYSIVIAVSGVDRLFLHDPGANDTFYADDIKDWMLSDISHFHFGYPTLMRQMYENDGEELYNLFHRVKEKGITTSLDMSVVDPNSLAGKVNWRRILSRVLPLIDFFVPSIEEIGFMLNREQYHIWNQRANGGDITGFLSVDEDIKPLADEIIKLGAAVVMLKCGAPGIYYQSCKKASIQELCRIHDLSLNDWLGMDGFQKGFRPEKVISATGAGDVCIAAFLTAMLLGKALKECVCLAALAGAECVTTYDALSGLEPLSMLEYKLRRLAENQPSSEK